VEQVFNVLLTLYRGTPDYGDWIVSCLRGAWPKLVGNKLSAVCRPSGFKKAELEIEILEKDWAGAVKSVESELLEKLKATTAGEVKKIKFSVVNSR
jgi:hypothetical protein